MFKNLSGSLLLRCVFSGFLDVSFFVANVYVMFVAVLLIFGVRYIRCVFFCFNNG